MKSPSDSRESNESLNSARPEQNSTPSENMGLSFAARIQHLSKMELRTANQFSKRGIEDEYEFPTSDLSDDKLRKKRNALRLKAQRNHQYSNPEDDRLREARRQKNAIDER